MNKLEKIALVDDNDNIISYEEKMLVHRQGLLHRAFSILVFNDKSEILLHQRALSKYHTPGLWTNTCCSHLPQNIDFNSYRHDRLLYEMGFDCKLEFAFSFRYKIKFDNQIIENEIDHVYTGIFNGTPTPNPKEVMDFKWGNLDFVIKDIENNPELYTYWFKKLIKHANKISFSFLK
ncbi:MAG: isopentenyl-diphosphate Delta-isomerase [Bacteroidales bacterium]|nr:isopentenyl-diphosphate Delta-isomerase [Bacteroidales bacterium]MDD4217686.1 isopentenyl-diphosphate Delta-isomerase [Bacteroidales bacterium]MDY0142518.1 isopentenyl-diphosphate Delta-isomerase [Bacteroidales bacterium]